MDIETGTSRTPGLSRRCNHVINSRSSWATAVRWILVLALLGIAANTPPGALMGLAGGEPSHQRRKPLGGHVEVEVPWTTPKVRSLPSDHYCTTHHHLGCPSATQNIAIPQHHCAVYRPPLRAQARIWNPAHPSPPPKHRHPGLLLPCPVRLRQGARIDPAHGRPQSTPVDAEFCRASLNSNNNKTSKQTSEPIWPRHRPRPGIPNQIPPQCHPEVDGEWSRTGLWTTPCDLPKMGIAAQMAVRGFAAKRHWARPPWLMVVGDENACGMFELLVANVKHAMGPDTTEVRSDDFCGSGPPAIGSTPTAVHEDRDVVLVAEGGHPVIRLSLRFIHNISREIDAVFSDFHAVRHSNGTVCNAAVIHDPPENKYQQVSRRPSSSLPPCLPSSRLANTLPSAGARSQRLASWHLRRAHWATVAAVRGWTSRLLPTECPCPRRQHLLGLRSCWSPQ